MGGDEEDGGRQWETTASRRDVRKEERGGGEG